MVSKRSLILLQFIAYSSSFIVTAAQNKVIDSLKKVLATAKDDTNKVKSYNELSKEEGYVGGYGAADTAARNAMQLAQKLNYKPGEAMAYRNIGVVYWYAGKYPLALENYNKALRIAQDLGDKHTAARIIGNIGLVYESQGDYLGAIEYYQKALKSYRELGDKMGESKYIDAMGIVYRKQGNYPKALECYLQALQMAHDIGDKDGIAQTMGNIGIIYDEQGDYKNALDYDFKALKASDSLGDKMLMARATGNIAIVYDEQGDHAKALEFFQKALKISEDMGDKDGMALNMGNIGIECDEQGDYDKALEYDLKALRIKEELGDKSGIARNAGSIGALFVKEKKYKDAQGYLEQALNLANEVGSVEIARDAHLSMSRLYDGMGQWQKAYDEYKVYGKYKDSLVNLDKSKQIGKLEAKADFDKQLAVKQAEADSKAALDAVESKRQRMVIAFIGALALGVGCIALIVFRNLKITRKQKAIIEEQKSIVEEKNKDITDSITYASRIQKALLTTDSYVSKYIPNHFIFYKPRDIVSGDFYWAIQIKNKFWIACCDCTGHGVPGAFMSILNISLLNEAIVEKGISSPDAVLNDVRHNVIRALNPEGSVTESKDGMDCVLCCIDFEKMEMQSACANNPVWILPSPKGEGQGEVVEIPPDKIPVGVQYGEQKPYTLHTTKLNKGDMLYLFTDGYADQFGGPKGKKFKYKQLQELLIDNKQLTMNKQRETLDTAFEQWKGNLEQVDDVLIIGVKI